MQFSQFHFLAHLPGLNHCISTRHGGVSKSTFTSLNLAFHVGDNADAVRENRHLLAKAAGYDAAQLVAAQQVHGDHVFVARRKNAGCGALDFESAITETDALITVEREIPLLIQVADCAPVLLADAAAQVLGVCHAGWRGAAGGIGGKTLRAMKDLGAHPKSTFVGIGPCLCTKCLEVGEEVADLVTPHYPDAIKLSARKPHLDLRAMIRADLQQSGVKADHIEALPDCPRCNTQKYFSYRGERKLTGRFGLVAWWE